MVKKPRFSWRRGKVSGARYLPLVLFCLALPARATAQQPYYFLDLTLEPARSIDGTLYEAGTLLDAHGVRFDRNQYFSRVMGYDGKWHETEIEGAHQMGQNHSAFFLLPWNSETRNVWCDPTPPSTALINWAVITGLICLPLMIVPIFSAIGADKPQRYWWLIVSLFMFINEGNIFKVPMRLQDIAPKCAAAQALISAHPRSEAGNRDFGIAASVAFLPFTPSEAKTLRAVPQSRTPLVGVAVNFFWQIIWFACLIWQVPAAIVGVHYLVVRHPAERLVRRRIGGRLVIETPRRFAEALGTMSDPKNPPPEFVSRNQTRRVRALTELLRSEAEAALAVVQYERARRAAGKGDKKP